MNFRSGYGNNVSGYPKINLDRVDILRPSRGGKYGEQKFDCYRIDSENGDELLGSIGAHELPDNGAVIPDFTGAILTVFHLDCEKNDGGVYVEMDTVWTQQFRVISWLVDGKSAEPVVCEILSDGDIWCIETPDGKYIFPECARCESLDEAKEYARDELITQRERRKRETRPIDKQAG